MKSIKLDPSWLKHLEREFHEPYFQNLKNFLTEEIKAGKTIYPHPKNIFSALNTTLLSNVKVVIIGQDPYHGQGQAHGLSFSVPEGIKTPPSLVNIFKEIQSEFGGEIPKSGNLTRWAKQGVLLLNATLTVEAGNAGSHQNKGWETFTDQVIKTVSTECEHVVFLLWGAFAQKKSALIESTKHCVLKAPHPSPLSAHRGFLGCGHFEKANQYLFEHGKTVVNW